MNPMNNGVNKMLSIEEFEQKIRQQKDPMKISLTNPMVNFESNSMQVSPISPNPNQMGMNPNIDYNQMKKQKEFFANSMANGLKSKSSNSSMNSSNNLYRMNSDQTLMQSPRFGPGNPGMGGSMPNMELPMQQSKYLNNSDLTIDTSFRPMDNGSYDFNPNPMMGSKIMNSNFNSSQTSFNSFGGFRDESFEEDSDFEDFLEQPKQRKQTETEALADFLKNTGPDMLGGPPASPAGSIEGKKKRGSLFKFKKGKKKEKKPSALSEEIGSGSSSPPSNVNTPKHTPIVIHYPGAENQPNLNSGQNNTSNSGSQQNTMYNPNVPNQFVMNNNGPNPNVPPMPTGFNNLKSSGSVSSINSLQGNGSPYVMSLKNKPDIPESPLHEGGPRFNNFQNSNLMSQQLQAQNMPMNQKPQGDNFPYNKPGMMTAHSNGSNGDLSIQSPITGPQDPRKMNKMKGMNPQDQYRISQHIGSAMNSPSNSTSNSGSMNNQPKPNMMNNISVSTINNGPTNDTEVSPSVKNRIVENLENLSIERNNNYDELDEDEPRPRINAAPMSMNNNNMDNNNNDLNSLLPNKTIVEVGEVKQTPPPQQPQAASTLEEDNNNGNSYYDQGLLDDEDEDDYFSESDSELIRNTRFNANMVGDEFYYDKSFDSPIERPPPDPNRKTVQFNDNVKRISHVEYVSDDEQGFFSDEEPRHERPPPQHRNNNARREHRLTGSHGLRGPPPPRDHDRDHDRDRDREHRIRMSERRSSRHGPPPMRQNLTRVLNNQKQTINNRVTLPPPQMGEITVTNSMPGIEDYELEELEDENPPRIDSGNKNPPPTNPPPPVPFDKNTLKNLDNIRTSTPPPANFGKIAPNKVRHHMSQPPPATNSNGNAPPPLRVRPKVRHVQIQTRRVNNHNVAVQTTSYIEDISTIFKGDVEKSINVEILQNELINYREIIKRMNDELRDIKRENQQLTSDYRQMRHEREKMIENNKRKEIEFDDLSSRAHKKLKELIEDRQQLLDEKEKLQNDNEQMEAMINQLKKQIGSIEA
ncbi:hypothetical protein BCR36DRAFT_587826 [Piromyces finnis]|uniref:Uncharacterized protein n=1 Tax=Piromyces finnis TaxID=1754191 RepID=A0A1Y1UUN3_9FUNG|nr:hypothetical protein BCR36DRAFT_587826 [Piromyces finnis]|eukprot:ORX41718.1 hypothetical protein BCR36DRAFT_587826 [Piromyces finnis]